MPETVPLLQLERYDFDRALALERELGISHVTAQVLVRRGLSDADAARAFLAADERHEPSGFRGIDEAVALVEQHVTRGSRIVVHGDYDVDGVCATAILVRALRSLGADAGWFIPGRIEDGYGLSGATVQRLASAGAGLLITADCAITAVDEVAAARAAGLDVVVTDHHAARPDGRVPDCPVIHPALCGYPCPELCGAAVAYKLARALGAATVAGDGELELVALATVADLVPLRGENRRLVREGLRALSRTVRPGLRALMEVARVDPSHVDAAALGFRLAPRINAAGRVRRADAGLELLLTEDSGRALEVARELDAVNAERRAVEERIVWEAEAQVSRLGERPAYVLWSDDWHAGVIGIVASRIVERHHRPAILVALDPHRERPATGSGRGIPGFDLLGALRACAPLLERYGGHTAAAGLTVQPDGLEAFAEAFEAHAAAVLTPELLAPRERVDAVASGAELGLALADELALLEPCGMGNPGPRLLIPGARFTDVRPMGDGRHARFTVRSGPGHVRAVAFGCDGRPAGPDPDVALDATFRLERNAWNGAVEPRAVLRSARPSGPGAIDVLGEPPCYLTAAFAEIDLPLPGDGHVASDASRHVLDRRGESPLAVLVDVVATGEPVLAVCADVPRRIDGLRSRCGGFALTSYAALEREPILADEFVHVVALDPPALPGAAALDGTLYTHLAWGEPELRFAQQIHEMEYGLRASLVALYRGLRQRGTAFGEELERLLRGEGRHGLPARVAGRLIRVLAELELVSLDRVLPALAIAGSAPTTLERSPAYNEYRRRYEDGKRYLTNATASRSSGRRP